MEPSPSLPDDLTVDIVARVPRSHYPTLSLVSKTFRKLIASPKLYKRRSLLGIKEHRVYALLPDPNPRFHILHRKPNSTNRLVLVASLPPMPPYVNFVPVGSKTYVFNNLQALSVDCVSHTVHPISDMPQRMTIEVAAADADGKVYLIGDSFCSCSEEDGSSFEGWMKAVMVFDTVTQTWEEPVVRIKHGLPVGTLWSDAVVMEGKICLRSYRKHHAFVYEPKGNTWELDEALNGKEWGVGGCVIDDVLYYHDRSEKGSLIAFDSKQSRRWSVVKGLEEFLAVEVVTDQSMWSTLVKCGEKKLALFFPKEGDICCAEIALERRQGGGEIWGTVLSCDVVFEDGGRFGMVKCVSVTV